jgi:hypothetical protein
MTHEEAVELARTLRSQGSSVEDVLSRLRGAGATIIESIKVVRQVEHVRLGDAKEIVHVSDTWADVREANDELHRLALEALRPDE